MIMSQIPPHPSPSEPNQEQDWPDLMHALEVPPPSRGFSARIIAAAQASPRQQTAQDWRQLWLFLLLPKPVLGLSLAMLCGLIIGWNTGNGFFLVNSDEAAFVSNVSSETTSTLITDEPWSVFSFDDQTIL